MAVYALGDRVPDIDPSAFVHPDATVIGAGGAIVLDSDPVAEYDEMVLKATAAVGGSVGGVNG